MGGVDHLCLCRITHHDVFRAFSLDFHIIAHLTQMSAEKLSERRLLLCALSDLIRFQNGAGKLRHDCSPSLVPLGQNNSGRHKVGGGCAHQRDQIRRGNFHLCTDSARTDHDGVP